MNIDVLIICIVIFIIVIATISLILYFNKDSKDIKEKVNLFYNELEEIKKDYILYSKIEYLKYKYKDLYNMTRYKDIRYSDFNKDYKKLEIKIEKFNQDFIERELVNQEEYFDSLFKYKIDEQQRVAILTDDDNNLIVAGAGSGKTTTIIGKTKYLIEKKNVNPSEIITISFTNNAVENFKEKLNNDLVKCTTFHKLGLDILNENEIKKDIAKETLLNDLIYKYLKEDIYKDEEKLKMFVDFCTLYMHMPVDINENNLGEIYDYESGYDLETIKSKCINYKVIRETGNLTTLNHETVRSYEEYMIANYLYLNGVSYQYEAKYKYNTANKEYRQYHPDFYLDEYDIYLEHFGINKFGRAPQYSKFEEQRYLEGIKAKREIHKTNNTNLIETYSYNVKEGTLFDRIDEELKKYNVTYKKMDFKKIATVILREENVEMRSFCSLINKFIKMFKGNNYDVSKFDDFIKESYNKNNYRNVLILNLIKDIYILYQEKLKEENQIDFDDMINLATEKVLSGKYDKRVSYIIIDEFQDVSYSRYSLIRAIQKKNNAKVIAVGDDWQSIYRFSGCDLDLFVKFDKYFEHPKILYIEHTYRNSQELINISSSFIMKNRLGQLGKNIISDKSLESPISLYYYKSNIMLATKKAIEELKNCGCKNIAILGRNNSDLKRYVDKDKFEKEYDLSKIFNYPVIFTTVHKSKGLEYDGVIVCNMENYITGFPNKMADDPVLDYVTLTTDDYLFAEERRLFYVALTRTKSKCILLVPTVRPSLFVSELCANENSKINKVIVENDERLHNPSCPICQTGILLVRENSSDKSVFISCSNYPKCKFKNNSTDIVKNPIKCYSCGGYLVKRKGPYGYFYGCINYPKCNQSANIETYKIKK